MRTYQFRYMNGQSMPYQSLEAENDEDFKIKLLAWEKEAGFVHVAGTVFYTDTGSGSLVRHEGPEFGPEARSAADAFFAHKAAHPEPTPFCKLTPLQRRMQDGFPAPPSPPSFSRAEIEAAQALIDPNAITQAAKDRGLI